MTVPSNSTCNAIHFSHHMKIKVWYWGITKLSSIQSNCNLHVVHTFLVLVKPIFVCIFCQLDRLHHDHGGPLLLHHFSNYLKLQNSKNFRTENGLSPGVTNWRWLPHRLLKQQSPPTTVLLRNPLTKWNSIFSRIDENFVYSIRVSKVWLKDWSSWLFALKRGTLDQNQDAIGHMSLPKKIIIKRKTYHTWFCGFIL